MFRPVGAIARYAACGGAGAAAYDSATNDESMLSHVIRQLVASASNGAAPFRSGALASIPYDINARAAPSLELAELSAKLDRLTSLSLGRFAASRGARIPFGAVMCATGALVGGLAIWAIATGRWWPTIRAKLELVEQAIGAVDAKVDARASELSAQLSEQHSQVLSAVSTVGASVCALDAKVGRLEERIAEMGETEKENNAGIKILCDVVATNFDLRQCPAPVLKRLHDFSGSSTDLVEARPAPRAVQPALAPVERQTSTPTLMEYLTAPSTTGSGRAAC
ncbi:hypothetical protein KFE25_009335 [Diacronema lutheri]|uniref:Peroxin-14 n=2 Tax=Diacronema lutheri TaxID=2081491 RepID=A0A8J5Y500_DIALT|nr:hypothetical protein KFE25_009335 [Diacronema lutheri]